MKKTILIAIASSLASVIFAAAAYYQFYLPKVLAAHDQQIFETISQRVATWGYMKALWDLKLAVDLKKDINITAQNPDGTGSQYNFTLVPKVAK